MKPLGHKSYGSIPHLQGSRVGPADRHCEAGQQRIATVMKRDKHDSIYVQEKLDGGNVGIAKIGGKILALTRAGYLADTSPYKTHHSFKKWVENNEERFHSVLNDGERLCGEWLLTAVGTKYHLTHEPFVAFDIMVGPDRFIFDKFIDRVGPYFVIPQMISYHCLSIEDAVKAIANGGGHGAQEDVEGAIWRVERKDKVDFLCKFVRPTKVDGKYLDQDIFNILPSEFDYLKYV
jgi:hypothetical protein